MSSWYILFCNQYNNITFIQLTVWNQRELQFFRNFFRQTIKGKHTCICNRQVSNIHRDYCITADQSDHKDEFLQIISFNFNFIKKKSGVNSGSKNGRTLEGQYCNIAIFTNNNQNSTETIELQKLIAALWLSMSMYSRYFPTTNKETERGIISVSLL